LDSYATEYWKSQDSLPGAFAANGALFRFFAYAGFDFGGKRVLEVGFLTGADLLEAQRRGSQIYGLDLSEHSVARMKRAAGSGNFAVCDMTRDEIPFDVGFDAIYSIGVLCYWSDDEIAGFAAKCFRALVPGGLLVVEFIQCDYERTAPGIDLDDGLQLDQYREMTANFGAETNPFRFLKPRTVLTLFEQQGFSLVHRKGVLESYRTREEYFRYNRYFMFQK